MRPDSEKTPEEEDDALVPVPEDQASESECAAAPDADRSGAEEPWGEPLTPPDSADGLEALELDEEELPEEPERDQAEPEELEPDDEEMLDTAGLDESELEPFDQEDDDLFEDVTFEEGGARDRRAKPRSEVAGEDVEDETPDPEGSDSREEDGLTAQAGASTAFAMSQGEANGGTGGASPWLVPLVLALVFLVSAVTSGALWAAMGREDHVGGTSRVEQERTGLDPARVMEAVEDDALGEESPDPQSMRERVVESLAWAQVPEDCGIGPASLTGGVYAPERTNGAYIALGWLDVESAHPVATLRDATATQEEIETMTAFGDITGDGVEDVAVITKCATGAAVGWPGSVAIYEVGRDASLRLLGGVGPFAAEGVDSKGQGSKVDGVAYAEGALQVRLAIDTKGGPNMGSVPDTLFTASYIAPEGALVQRDLQSAPI